MSRIAVARNYADTLLTLADRTDDAQVWLEHITEVSGLYREVPSFRAFLETPRVSLADKRQVIEEVFGDRCPEPFVRFLLVLLENRRQGLPDRRGTFGPRRRLPDATLPGIQLLTTHPALSSPHPHRSPPERQDQDTTPCL